MSNFKKTLVASAIATGMAFAGVASAQTITSAAGPAVIKGVLTVDNTAVPGGSAPDFTCKAILDARLGHPTFATPGERITGVQTLDIGQGFMGGAGCPFVDATGLPWPIEFNVPAAGQVTIRNVTIASDPALGQPGCPTGDIVAAWAPGNPGISDPIGWGVITLNNTPIGGGAACVLAPTGPQELTVKMPVGPN